MLRDGLLLIVVYAAGLVAAYVQTICMGTVGRGVLFKLRNELFTKLSSLPHRLLQSEQGRGPHLPHQ